MWTYETSTRWSPGTDGAASAAGRTEMLVSSPSEFGGRDDRWNPELLLVAAVENCMMLTTLSVLQRQNITLRSYASRATGHLEKTAEGLRFREIDIHIQVEPDQPGDAEKIVRAISTAEKYCPVSNALKCPVRITVKAGN